MLVRRHEIKNGLRVIDPVSTPGINYTWKTGGYFTDDGAFVSYVCDVCGFPDQFVLREDEEVAGLRGTFCIQCAGLEDLEPIVQIVK